MLQWTTMSGSARLGLIVHPTDAEREYAYDRQSHFGKLIALWLIRNWSLIA
jgi:hypothetical protein